MPVNEVASTSRSRARVGGSARTRSLAVAGSLLACLSLAAFGTGGALAVTLPENRVYELVSPSVKNGSEVLVDSGRIRTAIDGSAIQFPSTGEFAIEYLSQRNPQANRWEARGITPLRRPGRPETVDANDMRYLGELSDDLDQGVLLSSRLLTAGEGANVATVLKLYVRNDLRSRGPGSYLLVSDAFAPVSGSDRPWLGGASEDFTHVVFSSSLQLTPDAPPQTSPVCLTFGVNCSRILYEWVAGSGVRLAGILPDTEGGGAPLRTVPGRGARESLYNHNAISDDGSRILFTLLDSNFGPPRGRLYMRKDGVETVRVDLSERSVPEAPQPAAYETASADGRYVFFTTPEALTDDDTNQFVDLYRADMDAVAGYRLTRLSIDEEVEDGGGDVVGVLGASADGAYVYFTANTQLEDGGPPRPPTGEQLLFAWHDGQTTFIGNTTFDDQHDLTAPAGFNLTHKQARVTPDGRHLLFTSRSRVGLTDDDPGSCLAPDGCREVYVYDAVQDELACASCRPAGGTAIADAGVMARLLPEAASSDASLPRAITDDGRRVFFASGDPLLPEDQNGTVEDVYLYDVPSGELHLISSGRDASGSYFVGASASGDDLFFATRERLVRNDADSSYDIYDARAG
jgi:hypothetical protein